MARGVLRDDARHVVTDGTGERTAPLRGEHARADELCQAWQRLEAHGGMGSAPGQVSPHRQGSQPRWHDERDRTQRVGGAGRCDSNQRIFNVHTGVYSPVSLRCDAGRVRGADASASMAAHHRLTFR